MTDNDKTIEQLTGELDMMRRIVELAPDAVFVLSAGTCVFANAAGAVLLGAVEPGDLIGRQLAEPVPLNETAAAGDGGQTAVRTEARMARIDGSMAEVELAVLPFIYHNKPATQIIARDISDRKMIERELTERNKRIAKELQLANTIQSSLFPINLPQVSGATLAATAVAANEVGGDYCDLFVTKHNKLGIAIGDVMGKGVPAALFVAMTYSFVRNFAIDLDTPSAVVNKVNKGLYPQLELTEQFITFFYALYNPLNRELVYTNAGHNPPIIFRAATGECESLPVRDYFMGGIQEAQYREGIVGLCPGDVVLFYTDGLKEGRNRDKEQFGMNRIIGLLKENSMYDPASIQEIISCEFNDFLAGEPPYDDVTMIVIKIDSV